MPKGHRGAYRFPNAENEVHLCKCGCKQQIAFKPWYRNYGYPQFIHGHYMRGHTKENDPRVAAQAKKNGDAHRGRSKETHPYIAIAAKKVSETMIRERTRAGVKHGSWQGGISFEPYTTEFNEYNKELIRERDNHTCQKCGVPQIECTQKLTVHHIDYIKAHSTPDNMISLCNPCNGKVNTNREYWTEHFRAKLRQQKFQVLI